MAEDFHSSWEELFQINQRSPQTKSEHSELTIHLTNHGSVVCMYGYQNSLHLYGGYCMALWFISAGLVDVS